VKIAEYLNDQRQGEAVFRLVVRVCVVVVRFINWAAEYIRRSLRLASLGVGTLRG